MNFLALILFTCLSYAVADESFPTRKTYVTWKVVNFTSAKSLVSTKQEIITFTSIEDKVKYFTDSLGQIENEAKTKAECALTQYQTIVIKNRIKDISKQFINCLKARSEKLKVVPDDSFPPTENEQLKEFEKKVKDCASDVSGNVEACLDKMKPDLKEFQKNLAFSTEINVNVGSYSHKFPYRSDSGVCFENVVTQPIDNFTIVEYSKNLEKCGIGNFHVQLTEDLKKYGII